MSASGATDGRPHHQKPSFATLAAVVTDFRNEICQKQTSFNYLVSARQQRRRHVKPERLSGLEIDHKLELLRGLDRQFAGFLALEDASA